LDEFAAFYGGARMKKIFLLIALSMFSVSAFAGIRFDVTLYTDYVDGLGKVTITGLSDGRLRVLHDQNTCVTVPQGGQSCTEVAYQPVTVTPILISDNRATDGSLVLGLTERLQLVVSSGFEVDHKVHYFIRDRDNASAMSELQVLVDVVKSKSALADIHTRASWSSGYVDQFGKITIDDLGDGQFRVDHDRNTCSADGMACTKMAFPVDIVKPQVVQDRRNVDGSLILHLNDRFDFEVTAGFRTGKIRYFAIDQSLNRKIPLVPAIEVLDVK